MKHSFAGAIYICAAAFLWSTSGLFIKKVPVDPLFITAARSAIAGMILLPFLRTQKIEFSKPLLGYILAFAWMVSSFVTANKLTSAANVIALQYTSPLYLFIYTILTGKEKLGWRNAVPMLFIVFGIGFFLMEPNQGSSSLGNLLALSSGIAMAAATFFLHQLRFSSGIMVVSLSNLSTALLVLPFIPSLKEGLTLHWTGWLSLLYLGAVQIGLANVLFTKGLKFVSALNASILSLTEAVYNPLWVFLFLGERPSIYGLIGGIVILVAVTVNLKLRNDEEKMKAKGKIEEGGTAF
ncbi:MAG: DMT family transporter [Bacillota bacterium]